MMFFY